MNLLEFTDVHVHHGPRHALRGVSLHVAAGELVAVLGDGGAGKSTALAAAAALLPVSAGGITFDGRPLPVEPWRVVATGLAHVATGWRIFSTLTVLENLRLGGHLLPDRAEVDRRVERVCDLLPVLARRGVQLGGSLSDGDQRLVALGRALVGNPRLVLLDAPAVGLPPLAVLGRMEVIRAVNVAGTAVLLVERNARAALRIAHRGYLLTDGEVTCSGRAADLAADPRVRAACPT
jgi:branched-chain amino acid transport system ATP-binding protein